MAYPFTTPTQVTNLQAVDVIVAAEASILEGLNQLFCNEFVAGVLADTTTPVEDRFLIISNVLNTMACKECTVAKILTALSHFIVVDKGILPTTAPSSGSVTPCSLCK
ncbi:MAG: hypothetical protein RR620_12690 [Clostridium sp.]